jgi:translation initiation factor IF-2
MKKNSKIPVVVVLGHIDHGKSSLLEAIRKEFQITSKESGGITQHTGAYEAEYEKHKITFIDTPGHEAFSGMRSRGAKVADIAILVVAADDGVKPQTKEAIKIIKETKIPTIVALNKTDLENADPQRVKGELQASEVLIEEWGGDIPVAEVSAKTGKGIKELLSLINLLADVSELKSDIESSSEGFVLEGYLDSFAGPMATLVLEKGILRVGDVINTCTTYGKIKTMRNFGIEEKKEIFPGEAALVTGLKDVPEVGDKFNFAFSIENAMQAVEQKRKEKECEIVHKPKEGIDAYVKIVLKADVKGSAEVLAGILGDLVQEKMGIKILKGEVGDITDSDVRLADSEKAIIVGFRVKSTPAAQSQARQREVKIITFDVIYELIDTLRKEMEQRKEIKKEKIILGKIKPLVIFKTQKRGENKYRQIVGGKVTEGEIKRAEIEIKRGEEILPGGRMIEMQEQKKKIEKAKAGQEIGMQYEGKTKIKEDDVILVFEIVES